jgi:hypothetical protein
MKGHKKMATNPTIRFAEFVNAVMAETKSPEGTAVLIAAQRHPEAAVLAAACGKTEAQSIQFANDTVRRAIAPGRLKARGEFHELVSAEMKRTGAGYDEAYSRMRRHHPALFANAAGEAPVPDAPPSGQVPVFGHELRATFRLPIDATEAECRAAWEANGGQTSPMRAEKVFAALVELAQQQNGLDYEAAIRATKARFPMLWELVEQLSKQKA